MKALTILQPYAALIALPDDDDRAKRVENRAWTTPYRGELAIHASKSRTRLDEAEEYDLDPAVCVFGAVVAVARISYCFQMECRSDGTKWGTTKTIPDAALRRYPWLAGHEHVEGSCCWVLTEVRRLAEPIPCPGKQGLWTPSREIVEAVRDQMTGATA